MESCLVNELICESEYSFKVQAQGGSYSHNSNFSNEATATTTTCPDSVPDAPPDVQFTDLSPHHISLTWTDNADNEDGYLFRAYVPSMVYNYSFVVSQLYLPANSTSASTGSTLIKCGSTYHYRVLAYNGLGRSESMGGRFSTDPCPE